MSGEQLPVGTWVTYDDEPLDHPAVCGIIVAPTAEELEHAKTYSDPVGPGHGDVLVQWDDEHDRSWERPADLQRLPDQNSYPTV